MIDNVMTDKYNVREFGFSFTWKIRYFSAQQHKFFYCKKCWLNPTKSTYASQQMYFEYSIN